MGYISIILGENDSGKSRYAENMIAQFDEEKIYLATMIPTTEENKHRIEKHKIQRRDIGFQTIECPYEIERCNIPSNSIVLLEDLSNLLGNELFINHRTRKQVLYEIINLSERCKHLVIVSISGLDEGVYQGETFFYVQQLNRLNQSITKKAELVVEMKNGQAFIQKGGVL